MTRSLLAKYLGNNLKYNFISGLRWSAQLRPGFLAESGEKMFFVIECQIVLHWESKCIPLNVPHIKVSDNEHLGR